MEKYAIFIYQNKNNEIYIMALKQNKEIKNKDSTVPVNENT